MFSIDTESGFRDVLSNEGPNGSARIVVQGAVTTREFYVPQRRLSDGATRIGGCGTYLRAGHAPCSATPSSAYKSGRSRRPLGRRTATNRMSLRETPRQSSTSTVLPHESDPRRGRDEDRVLVHGADTSWREFRATVARRCSSSHTSRLSGRATAPCCAPASATRR